MAKKRPQGAGASRAGRELDPGALRAAMMRRVGRRSAATVRLTLPAVPALVRQGKLASMSTVDGATPEDELPHAPQNLDLIRRHLTWTPAQRLAHLRRVLAFVARGRRGHWRPLETAHREPGGQP